GVAGTDDPLLAVELEPALTLEDEVELLARGVVVALGHPALRHRGLREALGGGVVQLADRRAVLRRERLPVVECLDVQGCRRTLVSRSIRSPTISPFWSTASAPAWRTARWRSVSSSAVRAIRHKVG